MATTINVLCYKSQIQLINATERRFEIISVSREENFLPCSTEWDKSAYFTPSNLLPKSVVKMKHLT